MINISAPLTKGSFCSAYLNRAAGSILRTLMLILQVIRFERMITVRQSRRLYEQWFFKIGGIICLRKGDWSNSYISRHFGHCSSAVLASVGQKRHGQPLQWFLRPPDCKRMRRLINQKCSPIYINNVTFIYCAPFPSNIMAQHLQMTDRLQAQMSLNNLID